jgi:hypothetical protein
MPTDEAWGYLPLHHAAAPASSSLEPQAVWPRRESARSMMIAIKIASWKDAERGRALESAARIEERR